MERVDTDVLRLRDMLNAVVDARAFAKEGLQERKALMATAYAIAIIGEAASHLSSEFTAAHPQIPWKDIVGMRHRIIHGYGTINVARLEQVVTLHLPELERKLSDFLNKAK